MRRNAVFLLSVSLANCAPAIPPSPQVDLAEERAVFSSYRACLFDAARRLDDGKSDALTIAAAVVPACGAEREKAQALYGRGLPLPAQIRYRQQLRDHPEADLELATGIVLEVRAGYR
jgi:hypothetical protein